MDINGGNLYIADFILIPDKIDFLFIIDVWPVYALYGFVIVAALDGIVGLWIIDFMQIYVLMEEKFRHRSMLIDELTKLFFFDIDHAKQS